MCAVACGVIRSEAWPSSSRHGALQEARTPPSPRLLWAWGPRKEAAAQSLVTEGSPRAGLSDWDERETDIPVRDLLFLIFNLLHTYNTRLT